jgi:DNA-binding LytR/AlgR family response regulator
MNIVIVEDEAPAAEKLEFLIREYDPDINIIAKISSVKKAVNWFNNNSPPDLAFFDIHLGDGQSFEIFEATEVNCPVIFTTAYDEYALKAFKVNSIDYLLKPLDKNELFAALKKFMKFNKNLRTEQAGSNINYHDILNLQKNEYKNRFLIRIGEHLRPVPVEKIECFYSMDKATYVLTSDNKSYYLDHSLDQLEAMTNPLDFFRVSRKFIVNIHFIIDIISYSSSRLKVKLKDSPGQDIIVSRDKVKDFKIWLDR